MVASQPGVGPGVFRTRPDDCPWGRLAGRARAILAVPLLLWLAAAPVRADLCTWNGTNGNFSDVAK
jgi:hypothetical protein